MSNNMKLLKEDYPELYDNISELRELVFEGKTLDERTLKLIAIAITVASEDELSAKKQIQSGINEFKYTKDELMDVLKVVLLISGKPAFTRAVGWVYSVLDKKIGNITLEL